MTGSGTVTPPLPTSDTWTKRTLTYSFGDTRRGPDGLQQGWWKGCVIRASGDVFIAQGNPRNVGRGTFFFRNSLGYFERTNNIPSDEGVWTNWWKNSTTGGIRENYECLHDPGRNRIIILDGGPYGYSPTYGYTNGPHIGEMYYDVAIDEFFTPYPTVTNVWVPTTVDDVAHFSESGRGNQWPNFDQCYVLDTVTDRAYIFGGWSLPGYGLAYRQLATGAKVSVIGSATWPNSYTISRSTNLRGGMDYSTRQLWVLANNAELYMLNLNDKSPAWRHIPTVGNKPSTPPITDPNTDSGVIAQFHEEHQQIVAYCGVNVSTRVPGEVAVRNVWVLDLHTRVWRNGLQNAGPANPVGAVGNNLFYSPTDRRIRLLTYSQADSHPEVWDYYPSPTSASSFTQLRMPDPVGNYASLSFGFTYNDECKHVEMAYCPANGRIYMANGDTQGSNTLHIHSMDPATGEFRLESGFDRSLYTPYTWPYAFPNGFQDEFLWQWSPVLQRFILGFAGGDSYVDPPDVNSIAGNCTKGVWFFDPAVAPGDPAGSLTQDLRLFNSFEYSGVDPGIRSQAYDADTHRVYAFSQDALQMRIWDIATMTQLASVNLGSTWRGPAIGSYSIRNAITVLNGYVYGLGVYNATGNVGDQEMFFARYNIATQQVQRLSTPPSKFQGGPDTAGGALWNKQLGFHLLTSGSRLVWPVSFDPDGKIWAWFIYDPSVDLWTRDNNMPTVGSPIGNSFVSLPDGRIMFGGATFASPRQTHFYFYTPPQ